MSKKGLHDLLAQLKEERSRADLVDSEHEQRLDEIVESLEQQRLYPDTFDQYSTLIEEAKLLMLEFESEHPKISAVLRSLHQLLNNFRS